MENTIATKHPHKKRNTKKQNEINKNNPNSNLNETKITTQKQENPLPKAKKLPTGVKINTKQEQPKKEEKKESAANKKTAPKKQPTKLHTNKNQNKVTDKEDNKNNKKQKEENQKATKKVQEKKKIVSLEEKKPTSLKNKTTIKTQIETPSGQEETPKPKKAKKQVNLMKPNSNVKIYSLGGLGVVGMNMYVVEQNNEILIMDAGILFADDDTLGVNYIIPDFSYLEQNQDRIIGLFITHGHEDHIGAIPFLLQKVDVKAIYAAGLAVGLIKNKMLEFPTVKYNLQEFKEDDIYKFKNFEVSFFHTNHSIPDSYGIAIKTNLGYVVNTGDFKFDFSPVGHPSDFYKMTRLGELGVYCLLAESTNANIPQFSASERKIGETLLGLFHQIEGRIIVATFASNVYRVQQIIQASVECGRKVLVFGHSMEKTIEVAVKLNYIKAPPGWILNSRELKKLDTDHITILCTGSQGEPLAALSRIASGTHKQIKLKENDTIIYSSKPIPGNEQFINRNINKLVHAGAHVIINSPLTDTHTTGHASQNELRLMLAFMKPKYFVPIHGEYAMLKRHVEIAEGQGIKKENCFVLGPGDVLSLNKQEAKVLKKAVQASDIYLDTALSDVDSNTIKERKQMADDGVVSITYFANKKHELITDPIIETKGYLTPDAASSVEEKLITKAKDIYIRNISQIAKIPLASLEKQIANQINQYLFHIMDRKPLIVVSIREIKR